MFVYRSILLFLLVVLPVANIQAAFVPEERTETMDIDSIYVDLSDIINADIYFRLNDERLYEEYKNNSIALEKIHKAIDSIGLDRILNVDIVVQSSPEGVYLRNRWLTEHRTQVISDYIYGNWPLLEGKTTLHSVVEAWDDLAFYVAEDSLLSQSSKDRILSVIYPESTISLETKKWRMENRLGSDPSVGAIYSYIYRRYYPLLRGAGVQIKFSNKSIRTDYTMCGITFKPLPDKLEEVNLITPNSYLQQTGRIIAALKTNLLYDVATLLNYSLEIPIGRKYSALLYHQFPWWKWGESKNQYCIRFLSVGTEGRWWFKSPKRLQGHYCGIYSESGKWDFQWNRSICHQGEFWSVGASYGYSMPLGECLNLELSLSVGYASIAYRKYEPSDNYEYLWRDPLKSGRWNYFGPTKAQVSLVLPINVGTKLKGVAR